MFAVIFDVTLKPGHQGEYFDLAAGLRPRLDHHPGFISIARFQNLAVPDHYLSLSFWRDAEAIRLWRDDPAHRAAQRKGQQDIFQSYRLRVGSILRDYGMTDGQRTTLLPEENHGA